MSWRIFRTAPVNRKVWSTMIVRFFCAASSISSSACWVVEVNGFSMKRCLPFCSAAFPNSKCVLTGVTTATASIAAEVNSSAGSLVTRRSG